MDFTVEYLSFFVIQTEGSDRHFKHYKTLDREAYAGSELKEFLDGEFTRIIKRKVEKHPNSEQPPTKIGRFLVEPGYDLASNPNYSLFHRLRTEPTKDYFFGCADELVRTYMNASAMRGGALIIARARAERVSSEPFVFVMKCDFEPKIARISDEHSLITHVEMAINAKNMKSIQYPHMQEEGMLDEWELKVHQASHARYFEDFLKYISYEKSMPEIISHQVFDMVQEYMDNKWQGGRSPRQGYGASDGNGWSAGGGRGSEGMQNAAAYEGWGAGASVGNSTDGEWGAAGEEPMGSTMDAGTVDSNWTAGAHEPEPCSFRDGDPYQAIHGETASEDYAESPIRVPVHASAEQAREAKELELWAASDKRNLQEKWSTEQVIEASQRLIEEKPELELKFKLDDVLVKAKLADFGDTLHIAQVGGRYVLLLEGDAFRFEKGFSPVELLAPESLEDVVRGIGSKPVKPPELY